MQPYADRVASRIGWEHCDRARPGRRPCGETGRHKRILSQRLNPPLRVPFGPTRPEVLPCRTTPAGGCTRGEASAQMLTRTATRNMGRLAIGVAWGLQAADAQLPRTESGQGSGISAAFRDCGPDRVGGSCSSSANAGIVEVAGLSVTVAHYGAGLTAGPLDGSVPGPGPAKCDEAGVFVCARARARVPPGSGGGGMHAAATILGQTRSVSTRTAGWASDSRVGSTVLPWPGRRWADSESAFQIHAASRCTLPRPRSRSPHPGERRGGCARLRWCQAGRDSPRSNVNPLRRSKVGGVGNHGRSDGVNLLPARSASPQRESAKPAGSAAPPAHARRLPARVPPVNVSPY